jgi:hypothetical protein
MALQIVGDINSRGSAASDLSGDVASSVNVSTGATQNITGAVISKTPWIAILMIGGAVVLIGAYLIDKRIK